MTFEMYSTATLSQAALTAKQKAINREITEQLRLRQRVIQYAHNHRIKLELHHILVDPADATFLSLRMGTLYAQETNGQVHFYLRGRQVLMIIRPTHRSDWGNFWVELQIQNPKIFRIDEAEGWDYGRYYFKLSTALAESWFWLEAKGQLIQSPGPAHL